MVAAIAETEPDPRVVASNVVKEATSSEIAEVVVGAVQEAAIRAKAMIRTIHAVAMTAAEAPVAITDATIAEATPPILSVVEAVTVVVRVPVVVADLPRATAETGA